MSQNLTCRSTVVLHGWRERRRSLRAGDRGFKILQSQVDYKSLEDRQTLHLHSLIKMIGRQAVGVGAGAGAGRGWEGGERYRRREGR